jgi:radical SAM protein with 4Fe4S-binding SPASM domain
MPIVLSASIDGKYCEINRPFKAAIESGEPNAMRSFDWKINPNFVDSRGDEFYDKFFTFAAKYNFGFHPMVYSENIEYWRDNFLWFQENFRKHDISWKSLYLLEVRNAEWSLEQCKEFAKFTEFLVMWSWNMCNQSYDNYKEFLFRNKGFNMLSSPLTTIGRGIGCSYQSSVQLRLGDLNIMPCHRTCYPHLMLAKFNVQNNKIAGLNAQSPELWIGSFSTDSNTYPYCEQCGIKNLCTKGCLGAQLESTGDMFTPIPSTCRMEHYKLKGMITAYKRIGIFNELINSLDSRKIESFKYLEGLI